MRKITRVLTLTLAIAVICGSFATIAYAKDLAECHHCNTTGEFHCKVCNNTGEVTCGVCGGEGKSKCTGESGKGCDDGYYTCPNCNGDGKMRNGAGEVLDEGVCGNCNGSGKMRCVVCHTVPGWNICNRCDGKGKEECQSSNFKDSKAVGWKCHYCMGAGYLLTNFWPGENDGIQNVPVNGDLIWIGDKSHVYSNGSVSSEPASYHNVSFGTGSWKIGDVTVTADKTGTQKISTIEIITLTNFDPDTMEVRVVDEDGDGLILKVTNGKTSISANDHDGGIPYDLTFMVCEKEAVPGGNEGGEEPIIIPPDRNQDFEIPLSNEPDRTITSSVRVEVGKMTDEEQKYYTQLPEKELAQILTNVRTIVASAEPGRSDSKTDELLNSLAIQNGYGSLPEGRLFPLYFEGHQEIGFPVHVTVSVEKGLLDGGTDLYVYHIAEDGIIELLGKAEYGTYEDGTIESISFYTSSFSTFFTSAKELDTDISVVTGDSESTDAMGSTRENETPLRFWIVLFAVMTSVIAVVIVGTIVVRKKRKKE